VEKSRKENGCQVVVVFQQNIHIEYHIDIGIRIAIPLRSF
jgi:hypothetical protein